MPTSWAIAVDWDRNGHFAGTDDNITSRVIGATWFGGQKKPYQDVADNSVLAVGNGDRRFSPENISSQNEPQPRLIVSHQRVKRCQSLIADNRHLVIGLFGFFGPLGRFPVQQPGRDQRDTA